LRRAEADHGGEGDDGEAPGGRDVALGKAERPRRFPPNGSEQRPARP